MRAIGHRAPVHGAWASEMPLAGHARSSRPRTGSAWTVVFVVPVVVHFISSAICCAADFFVPPSTINWPHAARMSRPRLLRTETVK